jgi:hypothetical protein
MEIISHRSDTIRTYLICPGTCARHDTDHVPVKPVIAVFHRQSPHLLDEHISAAIQTATVSRFRLLSGLKDDIEDLLMPRDTHTYCSTVSSLFGCSLDFTSHVGEASPAGSDPSRDIPGLVSRLLSRIRDASHPSSHFRDGGRSIDAPAKMSPCGPYCVEYRRHDDGDTSHEAGPLPTHDVFIDSRIPPSQVQNLRQPPRLPQIEIFTDVMVYSPPIISIPQNIAPSIYIIMPASS